MSLGTHTLNFYMAPMVHWPEVMVTYESSERFYSLQTDSENSVHWIMKIRKDGPVKREDITLIL